MKYSCFITPAFAVLVSISTAYAAPPHQQTLLVEVFTTTDWVVRGEPLGGTKETHQHIVVHIYELDGIQRFEAQLSSNLPTDQHQAKQIALQRIQKLDGQSKAAIQNAAVGLAKAMQYDIDRYPAFVFDGGVVVYGLTDLRDALEHYRTWRREGKR